MTAAQRSDLPGGDAPTDAEWALRIAAVDLASIGGVRLRASPGAARDAWRRPR